MNQENMNQGQNNVPTNNTVNNMGYINVDQSQVVAPTTPVDQSQVVTPSTEPQKNPSNKKNKFIIIGVIAAVAILIIVLIVVFGSLFGKDGLNIKMPGLGEQKEHQFINIYEKDNIHYYVDENSKLYTFSGYSTLEEFENGYAVFSKENEKNKTEYGVINEKEKEVIKPGIYSEISRASNNCNFFKVKKDDSVGVVDEKGKIIIPVEYEDIHTISYSGTNKCIFIVGKDDKYHYASSNGTLFLETEKPSYWGGNTRVLETINEEYAGIVEIEDNYYNTVTGEKININLVNDIYFKKSVYFDENGYQIFGKDGKVKEEYSFPGITEFEVYVTQTKHIVITGRNYKDKIYTAFYRIYDMDFKLLKSKEIPETYRITLEEVNDKYFYLSLDKTFTKTKNYKTILFDSKLNETVKESLILGDYHETNNGELIYTESDYKKKFEAYNLKGEKLFSLDKNYGDKFEGELFTLYDMNNSSKYSVYNLEGKQLAKGFDRYSLLGKKFVVGYNYNYKETLVLTNGKKIFLENYTWGSCGDMPSAYNKKDGSYKVYDLEGNIILEQKIKEVECIGDKYEILAGEEKAVIYDVKNYKPIFEFDSEQYSYRRHSYDRGVEIIELENGFYTFDGKLVLSKESKQ